MGPHSASRSWAWWRRLTVAVAVLVGTHAHAGERWATTLGYEPQHVIVDAQSAEASRLEQSFPGRPRPRPLDSRRMTLNNVGVQVSSVLAALTVENLRQSSETGATAPGASAVEPDSPAPSCGTEDAAGLTLCVTPAGALRAEDRARVHAFLGGPTLVLTADAPGRTAMAAALDAVAPAGRDVIVREDAARVRPGTVRIERRTP